MQQHPTPQRRTVRSGRYRRAAATAALASVLLLAGTAQAAEPPPFPPPAGIELNEEGQPQGQQIDTTWPIVRPFKSAAEGVIHGAFSMASTVWNAFFPTEQND